jgi:hypothetical protein
MWIFHQVASAEKLKLNRTKKEYAVVTRKCNININITIIGKIINLGNRVHYNQLQIGNLPEKSC